VFLTLLSLLIPVFIKKYALEILVIILFLAFYLIYNLYKELRKRIDPETTLIKIRKDAIGQLKRVNKEFKGEAVPHGFRSTFRVWCLEKTTYSSELAELSMMHEVGDSIYKAYQRSDGLERRRAIMQDWSNFINKPYVVATKKAKNIVLLRKAKVA
jgi:integrase